VDTTATQKFLAEQKRVLFEEFTHGTHCVIASNPEQLKTFVEWHDWQVENLPGSRNDNVLVIRRKHAPNNPQCWVKWSYRGYRSAFNRFLKLHYPQYQNILSQQVHVDHMQPRFRFLKGSEYYVRLSLIEKEVNTAFGAGFERSFYEWERHRNLNPAIHMCWLTYCKVNSIIPPPKNSGELQWKSWAQRHAMEFSKKSGEYGGLAYLGFLSVLRLGYTQYYAGAAEKIDMDEVFAEYESQKLRPEFNVA